MVDRNAERGEKPKNTFFLPVAELAENNPQIAIPNPTSYQDMIEAFAPGLFDSIKIARVESFDKGELIPRWAIVDGHTKLKFALDHGEQIGITEVEVYDSTEELLRNPRIADFPGQQKQALSMTEYLRAVIAPTREHREIAPRRIAAHIIQGWEAMVGPELAQKFSATAALSLLNDPKLSTASERLLTRSLGQIEQLIIDETKEERQIIENSLILMNNILQQSQLRPSAVHQEALALVASQDPTIGGQEQAVRELYGLLSSPKIQVKLRESPHKDVASQQQTQEELIRTSLSALTNLQQEKGRDISLVTNALLDPELSLEETFDVTRSSNFGERYRELKIEKRQQRVISLLNDLNNQEGISDLELELATRFSETHLQPEQLVDAAQAIHISSTLAEQISRFLLDLDSSQENFIDSGVKRESIDEAMETLEDSLENMNQSLTHHQLRQRTKDLQKRYNDILYLFQQDSLYKHAQEITSAYLTPHIAQSFRPESIPFLERRAIEYLIKNHSEELFDKESAIQIITTLSHLDPDLLAQVLEGRVTLQHAGNLHQARSSKIPVEKTQTTAIMKEKLPSEIVELQNSSLYGLLNNLNEQLSLIELDPESIYEDNKQRAWIAINYLVKIIDGHPDAKRLVEEYPLLVNKITRLQEQLAQKNNY